MNIKFSGIALAAAVVLSSGMAVQAELHPDAKKDKKGEVITKNPQYGYVDDNGNLVIKYAYQIAMPFENGRAKVKKGDKWGYINEQGKAVIPIQYDNIEPFANGYARVTLGGKQGYMREDGTYLVKPEYDFIGDYNEQGLLWAAKGKKLADALKVVLRDNTPLKMPKVTKFGVFNVTDTADYTDGHVIFPNLPDEMTKSYTRLSKPGNDYFWFGGIFPGMGLCDANGKVLIKLSAGQYLGAPKDGWCLAMKVGKKEVKYNYLSTDGKAKKMFKKDIVGPTDMTVIPAYAFVDGHACAKGTDGRYYIYNSQGNATGSGYARMQPVAGQCYMFGNGNRFGLLDTRGNIVAEAKYQKLVPGTNTDGSVSIAAKNADGKWGFIGTDGKTLVNFDYEDVMALNHGLVYVKTAQGWGIVRPDGSPVIAAKWDNIAVASQKDETHVWVREANGSWYMHDLSTDTRAWPQAFAGAMAFDAKGRAIITDGKMYGAINKQGVRVLPRNFTTLEKALAALEYIDLNGLEQLTEADAYRMNIYNDANRHKYRMSDKIDDAMWDF